MRLWPLMLVLAAVTPASAQNRAIEASSSLSGLPRYVIEQIEVRGNRRTAAAVIRNAVLIRLGESISVDDSRLEESRFRLLGLGLFAEVQLRLLRGSERGFARLVVEVVERGTLVFHNVWFGSSRAVEGWGGADLTETNFAGQGISLGGAAFSSSAPQLPNGQSQWALRLRFSDGRLGRTPLSLSALLLFNDATEAYRIAGADSDGSPQQFSGIHYFRAGGLLGLGIEIGPFSRLRTEYRYERIRASVPRSLLRTLSNGQVESDDPGLINGGSNLSLITFTFERDTRADPVLPFSGSRLVIDGELSSRFLGADYGFYKLTVQYQQWVRLRWGHVLSFGALGGIIVGSAPIFERYYLGDIDPLVPPRALGMTLSTLPARNLLRSGIEHERYAPFAARLMGEYVVPLFRGGHWCYGADVFFDLGLVSLVTGEDLRGKFGSGWQATPIDLLLDTGVRLDTVAGIFSLSLGNALGRIPY